ncbi:MAG: hypothetical protein Q7K38_00745, partial [Candidatus Wildermuthbacteria bacterium]|nr:hypothetical protein [Candidatus Wildermuthbacteria bacterium]
MPRLPLFALLALFMLLSSCETKVETIVPPLELQPCENAEGFAYATYYYVTAPKTQVFEEEFDLMKTSIPDKGYAPKRHEFNCFHIVVDGKELGRTSKIQ